MQQERLLKVLVIGDLGVGKTSIIKRYVHQVFSQHYRATIGVDFALKVLNWDHKTVVRLQLWDIAGQERYGNMTRVYYREAVGALVVFDMTRLSTFQAVLKWKGDLDSKVALGNGTPVPAVLLANKCDQRRHGLCPKLPKLESFCNDYGFVGWYETSAKFSSWPPFPTNRLTLAPGVSLTGLGALSCLRRTTPTSTPPSRVWWRPSCLRRRSERPRGPRRRAALWCCRASATAPGAAAARPAPASGPETAPEEEPETSRYGFRTRRIAFH
ncbi:ras-related protein Rab-38 isoform X2 [Betta splendens]|uniref:Ras-related protein Rab n=1 Tax=Betta splendens TaxID=158456 RepID=A0A9W2XMW1_BETSP|nr:ras-related protein Rab-38 isoform X2 [Betta splendens]